MLVSNAGARSPMRNPTSATPAPRRRRAAAAARRESRSDSLLGPTDQVTEVQRLHPVGQDDHGKERNEPGGDVAVPVVGRSPRQAPQAVYQNRQKVWQRQEYCRSGTIGAQQAFSEPGDGLGYYLYERDEAAEGLTILAEVGSEDAARQLYSTLVSVSGDGAPA